MATVIHALRRCGEGWGQHHGGRNYRAGEGKKSIHDGKRAVGGRAAGWQEGERPSRDSATTV